MIAIKGGKPEDYVFDRNVMTTPSIFLATGNLVALIAFSFFILFDKQNEHIKSKLFLELNTLAHSSANVSFSDIKKLEYTDKVYKELLRYISPANLISRYTSQDLKFGDKTIIKGSYMMTSIKTILHDSDQWPLPHKFDPDRSMPKNFVYPFIPFSTGKRICPGIQTTEVVFKTFLFILKDYKFIADPATPFDSTSSIPMADPVIRLNKKYNGFLSK